MNVTGKGGARRVIASAGASLIAAIAFSALSSCSTMHNVRGYSLPDMSLVDSDMQTRITAYEAAKVSYEDLPGLSSFGPDVFTQNALSENDYLPIRSALYYSLVPGHDRFPPERVILEDLFRPTDAAYRKYLQGRSFETIEAAGCVAQLLGISTMASAGLIALLDLLTPDSLTDSDALRGVFIGGSAAYLGGVTVKISFSMARHRAYSVTADLYNEYLLSLYGLTSESIRSEIE